MITKIKGKYVIGHDGEDHVIYENGEVVFEDDTIIFVGYGYEGTFDQTIVEDRAIISPGFIDLDALGDIDHALIDSEVQAEMNDKLCWSEDYFDNHRYEPMTEEEEAFKSLYAYSHLIMNGITTAMPITSVNYKRCGETYKEIEAAAHNAGKLGLRVYLGPSYVSGMRVVDQNRDIKIKWFTEEGQEGLKNAVEFIKAFDGAYDGLINPVLVPERIELQTEEILVQSKQISRAYNCPIRLHAAQGNFEYKEIWNRHGMSPIAYLNKIGFLDDKTLIPHGIYASGYSKLGDQSDDDLDILISSGASIIHCPIVFARDGEALESFGRYVRKGIKMSMGTDTFPPDIIRNINVGNSLAMLMDSCSKENFFSEFFRAATTGGAQALGREDLGRLAPGAKADIIIIDMSHYHMGVHDDPIRTLMLSGTGRDVKTSIINGRVVMENGVIPDFDYELNQKKAQAYYEKMKKSYIDRSLYKDVEEDVYFKPSFRRVQCSVS